MNRSLDIAFFGSSLVSAYWNGAATYFRGLLRALAARGHRITFYEPDAFERHAHRDIEDPPWARVVVYSGTEIGSVFRVIDDARRADVIIKASNVGVWDEVLEVELLAAKRASSQAVFWDLDAPTTLERLRKRAEDPFRALVSKFDAVLTRGGGAHVVRGFRAVGARRCVPIYGALDPSTHRRCSSDPQWSAHLTLLANRFPDREARVEELFFRPARSLSDRVFLLAGNGWAGRKMPANVRSIGHVSTSDHNVLNSSARLVLDVSRDDTASCGWCPSSRLFEATGARACVITDGWDGIEQFLEPDVEVLVARDGEDVARRLRDIDEPRARAIGEAARKRVLCEHTYAHRAREVEALLLHTERAVQVSP